MYIQILKGWGLVTPIIKVKLPDFVNNLRFPNIDQIISISLEEKFVAFVKKKDS